MGWVNVKTERGDVRWDQMSDWSHRVDPSVVEAKIATLPSIDRENTEEISVEDGPAGVNR